MNDNNLQLNKSRFVQGTNCHKAFYLKQFYPYLSKPPSQQHLKLMQNGKAVELFARKLFDGGIDLSESGNIYGEELVNRTKRALETENQIFFQAAFASDDGNYCQTDVLVIGAKIIKVFEIKSSLRIKTPSHIYDLGFQYRVISKFFNRRVEYYLIHLNGNYVRGEEIELESLFVLERLTHRARNNQSLIDRHMYKFNKILKTKVCPSTKVGPQCHSPYPCEFTSHCWKNITKKSIENLGINNNKLQRLVDSEINTVDDLPAKTTLSQVQWFKLESLISGKKSFNRNKLYTFLSNISLDQPYYIVQFDFVTPPIPVLINTKPNTNICFQFNLLYQKSQDIPLVNQFYIAEPGTDPRRNIINQFLECTAKKGSIVIYDASVIKTWLEELCEYFPEYHEQINERISRLKDLMLPFKEIYYYDARLGNSCSLKDVANILCPEIKLENPIINKDLYMMNCFEPFKMSLIEMLQFKEQLIESCYKEALSMYQILQVLNETVNKKHIVNLKNKNYEKENHSKNI